MQCPFDPGAIIRVELAGTLVHVVDLGARHLAFTQVDLMVHKTSGGDSA